MSTVSVTSDPPPTRGTMELRSTAKPRFADGSIRRSSTHAHNDVEVGPYREPVPPQHRVLPRPLERQQRDALAEVGGGALTEYQRPPSSVTARLPPVEHVPGRAEVVGRTDAGPSRRYEVPA
ncbi:hypothetical protein DL764_010006 [Monosporascus ibericus]|uniref:Uncharacterized protein n=1 Tax=Monosporascus ibericus TaxID=155417 RepID=A0A4Q4STJ4_9PEZI|nr:hypothetical protein DL764_010006 [Monosporascus ibericus]